VRRKPYFPDGNLNAGGRGMAQEIGDWSITAAYWLNLIAMVICILYGIINISRKDEDSSGSGN